ncbi:type II secretion system F family protein [Shewanella algae]|uniref:type II secretion system F family protein n=1 Tax=Shewanella algae TaxID=38313 RepID=UPI001AADBE0D|nr:type II secretion system F family protein [Shewanella algae]MBO2589292.1 type II secretion system F family protein [Shewanella algae]MBO2627091.1 type II secretion system F family protein [Shewanella algae]MBO2635498.1 type II secretion system F family protein [Shewanella algae]MBO2656678.1 type II secretion system F family protein [Shewanella algae]MCE9774100.1 type II secretion system F family protein [Shewanella algae]
MATATATAKNNKAKNKGTKPQPKIHTFTWKGHNRDGKLSSGELRGSSITEIKTLLKSQGINPKTVRKKSASLFGGDKKIKPMDIAVITRQIATMLAAGVPLVTSIELIARGHEKNKVRVLLGTVLADVQAGIPLSDALRPHRVYFDDLYVDLVAAGEHSGSLDAVFDRIATYREKAEALKSKIKKAMFYPAAVVVVAIAVTALLLLFVVPQFEEIFRGFGAELPAFTQLIVSISRALQSTWYIFLAIIVISIWLFIRAHRNSEHFRNRIDEMVLKIPAIGEILHKAAMARFARTLATTFAAGVPLIDGLESAAGASGNYVYRKALLNVRTEVMAGMQMNVAMRTTKLFPDMLIQMVMIGEESGSLDNMLNKIANIYEMQVDDAVDGLSSLIEPVMMVVIGTLVGGLIVGMYLPIFQMGNVVG